MEHTRNGDLKVSYEQELFGRRRNGTLPAYPNLTREAIATGPARGPVPPKSTPSRRRTYADGELDVFSAERYFKGAMDGESKEGSATPVETVAAGTRAAVPVSKPASTCASVASAGSAATANSQTVLLREARSHPGYSSKKCCLQVGALLRPCSGKRAVRVNGGAATETTESSKLAASRIEWYRDLRMQKAGLGLAGDGDRGVVAGLPPNLNLGASQVAAVGSREKAGEYSSASFRKGSFTLQAPVKVSCGGGGDDDDDDGGSDSSSDLFEIKSLMIGDCPYEPSEASIQWSVVTASAVDMSAASEGGGARGRPPVAVRQNRDRPVGLLTGCVSRRAVDVSPMAAVRRLPDPPGLRRIDG
ncbi:protein PHYTOCHROME KINASE SUBSTRATE 1 [Hordeum vulgare]|uniref:Uncharacterized protein n=1 Tax=Hordeum vulgare subsp. vulgare TaxID=112509 RepID=M0V3I5_HORVV|nr:protein PHYTOCHROME KINASE SUBSTRATE 1-like [Hordeum vulgare subsp. vulgare]KAE8814470.1 protein PHYTOCHROME KINASE SUBSTRATE 1 [Hordeum vulgare]